MTSNNTFESADDVDNFRRFLRSWQSLILERLSCARDKMKCHLNGDNS